MDGRIARRGVRFTAAAWAAMLADARADLRPDGAGRERCGLLLGRRGEAGDVVDAVRPAANVAADPARHFEVDPAVLIAAWREARHGGAEVVGHYHSHPAGLAQPSATDRAMAAPDGRLWMIITADDARGWRCAEAGFVEVALMF